MYDDLYKTEEDLKQATQEIVDLMMSAQDALIDFEFRMKAIKQAATRLRPDWKTPTVLEHQIGNVDLAFRQFSINALQAIAVLEVFSEDGNLNDFVIVS